MGLTLFKAFCAFCVGGFVAFCAGNIVAYARRLK